MKYGTEWQNAACLSVDGNITAQSVTATPSIVTAFDTATDNNKGVADATLNTLKNIDAGGYFAAVSMAFSGSAGGNYGVEVFIDGVSTGIISEREIANAGDSGSMSGERILELSANTVIDIRAFSDGSNDMTIKSAGFLLHRLW